MLTAGDLSHVRYGIIAYSSPGPLYGQAWWVAPGFAVAVVGMVVAAWPFAEFIARPRRATFAAEAAWFFASYLATAVAGEKVIGLTSLLLGLWMYRLGKRPDRRPVAVFSAVLGVGGTLGEMLLHATGLCSYSQRQLWNVPAWLPALYMMGAPLALSVTRWVRGEAPLEGPPSSGWAQ